MLDLALKNIWQRKTRSLLTALGVGLAIMLYVYLSTIMGFYERDLERTVAGFAGMVVVQARDEHPGGYPPLDSLLPVEGSREILALPGITRDLSSPVLFETLVANPAPNMPPSVLAVGIEPGHEGAFIGTGTVTGQSSLTAPDQVLLGADAAGHYQARSGQVITIKGRPFEVVGLVEADTVVTGNAVIMQLDAAQELLARNGIISALLITVENPGQAAHLAGEIEAMNPRLAASTSTDMARVADDLLGPQRAFFATVQGAIIAVGVVVVMVVMIMAVGERRRELGTLKALGARRTQVISMVLAEAIALSLIGGVWAILVAWLLTRNDSMGVDPVLALRAILIAASVGAVAALWPSLSALRVDPIESLRHE